MSTPTSLPPEGWYPDPDPAGVGLLRWWDGTAWSALTRPDVPSAPASPDTPPAPASPDTPSSAPAYPGASTYPGAPTYPGTQAYPGGPGYPGTAGYAGATGYPDGGSAYAAGAPIGAWRSPVDDRPAVTGFGAAIRTVFAKYAAFDGRAGRPEFWYWALFEAIIVVAVYILIVVTAAFAVAGSQNPVVPGLPGVLGLLLWLWLLATALPGWAVTVRRLRDAGFHWAFILLLIVPFGGIAVLVLCGQPGKHP